MMSRPLITELPACGPSRGGNHPKTLRGPVGKERPAGPRSHIRESPRPRVISALLARLRGDIKLLVCVERQRRFWALAYGLVREYTFVLLCITRRGAVLEGRLVVPTRTSRGEGSQS
jgi:hypothetical protein